MKHQYACIGCNRIRDRYGGQTTLSNAGFADKSDRARWPAGTREFFPNDGEFFAAVDEWQAISAGKIAIDIGFRPVVQSIGLDGATVGRNRRFAVGYVQPRGPAKLHHFAAEDGFVRVGSLLKLGRDMHGGACDVEAKPSLRASLAQPHQAAMNPDTKPNNASLRSSCAGCLSDVPGRPASALRVVLKGTGPAEHRNAAVAGKMNHQPAGTLDRATNMFEPDIEERLGVFRVAAGNVAGRAHHIDRQDRYDVSLDRGCEISHRAETPATRTSHNLYQIGAPLTIWPVRAEFPAND